MKTVVVQIEYEGKNYKSIRNVSDILADIERMKLEALGAVNYIFKEIEEQYFKGV